ncbi:hypothetical protein [Flavobacterium sp. HNIBRBA15423]|uniref:hypothetical protein n=1 Tax=Flavobacterium sp. HNIBRBA15423 TaxID=3458683 RepID=UPI00404423FE
MINSLKIIFCIVVVVISVQKVSGNNSNPNCDGKILTIKTEFKIKHKYFFFRNTNHKRVKRIDEIVEKMEIF